MHAVCMHVCVAILYVVHSQHTRTHATAAAWVCRSLTRGLANTMAVRPQDSSGGLGLFLRCELRTTFESWLRCALVHNSECSPVAETHAGPKGAQRSLWRALKMPMVQAEGLRGRRAERVESSRCIYLFVVCMMRATYAFQHLN